MKKLGNFFKENYIFLIAGRLAGLIGSLHTEIMEKILFVIAMIIVFCGLIIILWLFINIFIKKSRIHSIKKEDYKKVKDFYYGVLGKNLPNDDCYYFSAADYLYTIAEICNSFLKGKKKLYEEKDNLFSDLNDSEIIDEMNKLKLDFLIKDMKGILIIIFNYYDEKGIWKRHISKLIKQKNKTLI